jgi:hypothetical protein
LQAGFPLPPFIGSPGNSRTIQDGSLAVNPAIDSWFLNWSADGVEIRNLCEFGGARLQSGVNPLQEQTNPAGNSEE